MFTHYLRSNDIKLLIHLEDFTPKISLWLQLKHKLGDNDDPGALFAPDGMLVMCGMLRTFGVF